MITAASLARKGIQATYGGMPRFTYAVGTSNGGYQVRRAVELAPQLFDGGVDWQGTYVDEHAPSILTDLPAGVLNFLDYQTSLFNANITAAKDLRASGYPPDLINPAIQRLSFSEAGDNVADFATTGLIQRPLITVQGTLDALLPIDHHGRAYARAVEAGFEAQPGFPNRPTPAYRLYEVQNGNHIENYKNFYSSLEYILPHAQSAFDLLVASVEQRAALPPNQCIPRGGSISATPAQPGHRTELFVGP